MESRQTSLLEFTQNCGKVMSPCTQDTGTRRFVRLRSALAFVQEKCSHFILVVFICSKITSEVYTLSPVNLARNLTVLVAKESSGHII